MPQIKQQVSAIGAWQAVALDALKVLRAPCRIHIETLRSLAFMADNPSGLLPDGKPPFIVSAQMFARIYAATPEVTVAVLSAIHSRMNKLAASKSGRIQRFICGSSRHYTQQDGEIALDYQRRTGEVVSISDVEKARKALASYVKRGELLAAQLTASGILCAEYTRIMPPKRISRPRRNRRNAPPR